MTTCPESGHCYNPDDIEPRECGRCHEMEITTYEKEKTMEVNFEDYLSDEDQRQIVRDVFARKISETLEKDWERIISNAAYEIVSKMVDDRFDGKAADAIAEKTVAVINDLTAYTVFKRKDYWEKDESQGFKVLNECILQNRDAIRSKIGSIIAEFDEKEIKEILIDEARYLLDEKLFGSKARCQS